MFRIVLIVLFLCTAGVAYANDQPYCSGDVVERDSNCLDWAALITENLRIEKDRIFLQSLSDPLAEEKDFLPQEWRILLQAANEAIEKMKKEKRDILFEKWLKETRCDGTQDFLYSFVWLDPGTEENQLVSSSVAEQILDKNGKLVDRTKAPLCEEPRVSNAAHPPQRFCFYTHLTCHPFSFACA